MAPLRSTIVNMKMSDVKDHALACLAAEKAGFCDGARILDIGCAEGGDVAYLRKEKGLDAEGIDLSLTAVAEAKKRYPDINVSFGDGEFLEEYTSFTFDGIIMQRVLALINLPDEALHEAYCVLKKGGRLVITDIYDKDPDPAEMKAVSIEAYRTGRLPHDPEDHDKDPVRQVDFRKDKVFYRGPLEAQLEEIGYKVKMFEELDIDDDGYLEKNGRPGAAYFMMIAEKPVMGR